MFVLKPDPFLKPAYRISPFATANLGFNYNLPDEDFIEAYLKGRFTGKEYRFTLNGREAIRLAIGYYGLKRDDVVTIITTSGNFYISSCVTDEIEKICKWSRQFEVNTKVLLVNHEFGYPVNSLRDLRETRIPIIEDCAHSFFTRDKNNDIGNIGDFVIYSLPKMFPIQIGGILVSNIPKGLDGVDQIDFEIQKYIYKVLSFYIKSENEIVRKRFYNYSYLRSKFKSLGFTERFLTDKNTVPGVFMFKTGGHKIDLPDLKKYFYDHGIQCSVFYGEEAFFIPVHQALGDQDMDYFYEVMKSFINK